MKTIKRLLLTIALGMLLVGCSPEDKGDCNCDRITYIISPGGSFGGPGQPVNFSTPGRFITINDCSGVQLEKTGYRPVIGQCR